MKGEPVKKKEVNPLLEKKLTAQAAETPGGPSLSAPGGPEKPVIHRHRRTRAELEAARARERKSWKVEEANPAIVMMIRLPFNIYAERINKKYPDWKDVAAIVEQIKMTDDEAATIALPATQLLNYYFPNQPEIAYVWANLLLCSSGVFMSKFKLLDEVKKLIDSKNPEPQKTGEEVNG